MLESMIRKNEKLAAGEVINAFNTGRSFQSRDSQKPKTTFDVSANAKLVDVSKNLRASQMRLNSGDSRDSKGNKIKKSGNVVFEINNDKEKGNINFELRGEQVKTSPRQNDLSPQPNQDLNFESPNKRKIITEVTDAKREVQVNVQSLDTLGNIPSEPNLHAYASQGNIHVSGSTEELRMTNLSPSKRTAAALEGSPMFTPLEVKFKNLTKIESSAKKQTSGRKYVVIDQKGMGARMREESLDSN